VAVAELDEPYGLGHVSKPMHAESPQLVFMNTAVEKHSGALGEHGLPTVRGAGAAGPNLDVHEGFQVLPTATA
jgi:hypothetical protein